MKATQALLARMRRLPLTTKMTNKGYYKGTGTGILGHWDFKNPRKFTPDWNKVRTFKLPEAGVENFELTPFVVRKMGKYDEQPGDKWSVPQKTISGEDYLDMWKSAGGHDFVDLTPAEVAATSQGSKK